MRSDAEQREIDTFLDRDSWKEDTSPRAALQRAMTCIAILAQMRIDEGMSPAVAWASAQDDVPTLEGYN